MPRRPRARQSRPVAKSGRAGTGARGDGARADGATASGGAGGAEFVEDPTGSGMAELRRIQPYQATKTYICPGCNQEIRPGTGHVVIVPLTDPSGRRHWHSPCWEHRRSRRTTGR